MVDRQTQKSESSVKRIATIAVILVCALAIDAFYTGFIKFGYTYVKCGGAPIAVRPSAFGVGQSRYLLPGKYFPGGAHNTYFCTEAEAQAAGFQRDGF